MGKLGVSIYPSKSTIDEDKKYLKQASKYGFTRIFTSLLEVEGDGREVIGKFKDIINYGNSLGMETTLDINPGLFDQLGVSYEDLSFFKEMGAHSIRLDLGFTGKEEALMTKNDQGLKIEVNMSSGTKYIDTVMSYQPNRENLIASHNFYPMKYSGLSREHFNKTTEQFHTYRLNTAAFITSQAGELGPWPVQSGLCSLEEHRNLPIEVQVIHYKLMDTIDDLIIGNAYATESELKIVSEVFFQSHLTLPIRFKPGVSELEKRVILDELHSYRGDRSDYLIRSSMTRITYREEDFPAHDTKRCKKGSVLICNENFGQYKGETQIALQDLDDDGTRNVVAEIPDESVFLLEDLSPWSSFQFTEV